MAGTDTAAGVHIFPALVCMTSWAVCKSRHDPSASAADRNWNPAKFMDRLSDMGTVEKGKLADLVLLDANPLDDISNTRKIRAVVLAAVPGSERTG